MQCQFNGFPKDCVEFYSELTRNNDKIWFEKNREWFDESVMAPAREFVAVMGQRLKTIAPEVNADPRVNKSLFKIHRDTRFSPDKTPFKTHLGIMFWEGVRKRMECSCFYFHLEPPDLMVGCGIYMFPKPHLAEYRDSVVHPKHGSRLVKAILEAKQSGFDIGGMHYKKTPRGFDPEHEYSAYLLHNGLTVGTRSAIPNALSSSKILDFCFERFEKMAPVHRWLVELTERL